MNKSFGFKIVKKDKKSKARAGEIETAHGIIETPAFVPVGTRASVRSLTPEDLKEIGVQLIFGNTYHLHLRPGEETVKEFGGVAKFMGWDGPTITDSGGFQVFSLGKATVFFDEEATEIKLVKIKDEGVVFRSHIDGSSHEFTPEISIGIQKKLGADIILALDECPPNPSTHEATKEATDRTHKWAIRSLKANEGNKSQALYGIVQGGVYEDLREKSAKFISSLDFNGIAIGGVAVGETKKEMRDAVEWVVPFLPDEKPRHLLGVGEIDDLFDGVERGMDTFDCVIPTRFGRYGIALVGPKESEVKGKFRINLPKTINAKDKGPIAKNCNCYVCQNFTRGYIHHLFRSDELLGYRLVSYHNVYFITDLFRQIRQAILEDRFEKMKKEWLL